jgi:hypothetical protein
MMVRGVVRMGVVLTGLWMLVSACTLASPTTIKMEPSGDDDDDSSGKKDQAITAAPPGGAAAGAAGSCTGGKFAKPDVSKLTACGTGGKAHCYDKTKIPAEAVQGFNPCPNAAEVCIPDEILTAGGGALKSCTSIIGKGACVQVSQLNIPAEFKSQLSALKPDVCDSGMLCTPCTNPLQNNAPNPLCNASVGVFDSACSGGAAAPAGAATTPAAPAAPQEQCCKSGGKANGICMSAAAVPEANKGDAPQDTCSSGNVCIPAFVADPKGPTRCTAGPFGLGGPGVCMDQCFNSMLNIAGVIFGNDGCGQTETCVPCAIGKDKGLPGCT